MTITLFVGVWLASYRLWKLLAKDVIFDKPRKWFFRRFPPDPATAALVKASRVSYLGVFIACAWCSGAWLSFAVVAVVCQVQSIPLPVMWGLATSAAVGLVAKNLDN